MFVRILSHLASWYKRFMAFTGDALSFVFVEFWNLDFGRNFGERPRLIAIEVYI